MCQHEWKMDDWRKLAMWPKESANWDYHEWNWIDRGPICLPGLTEELPRRCVRVLAYFVGACRYQLHVITQKKKGSSVRKPEITPAGGIAHTSNDQNWASDTTNSFASFGPLPQIWDSFPLCVFVSWKPRLYLVSCIPLHELMQRKPSSNFESSDRTKVIV